MAGLTLTPVQNFLTHALSDVMVAISEPLEEFAVYAVKFVLTVLFPLIAQAPIFWAEWHIALFYL